MGLPSLQALGFGGGGLCFCQTFFRGGARALPLGGVGVWEGIFFCFTGAFLFHFSAIGLTKCTFEVAGLPCNAVQCCGVLWYGKV